MDINQANPILWIPSRAPSRNTSHMETWRDRAKARMKELGMSQERLAELHDMTTAGMQKWLAGTRQPSIDDINQIAHHLNVSPAWLTHGMDTSSHVNGLPEYSKQILSRLIKHERSGPLPNSFWVAIESMANALLPGTEDDQGKSVEPARDGTNG